MATSQGSPEREIRFDREKLIEAVYEVIALRAKEVDTLGKTKLHKALYYSDMLAFADRGEPVTGVEYVKQPFGPTARYLNWALKELEQRSLISVGQRNYFGLEKYDFGLTTPERRPTNRLDSYERSLIADVVEFVCGFSAKEISEISHAAPWQGVRMGERIPYASAFLLIPQEGPTRRDIRWGSERTKELSARVAS
jgi:uncharacterized phage-associated protein